MDTDISLIEKIKQQNDSESLQCLIDKHSGIYIETVNKTIGNASFFIDKNEILEEKDYHIYSAALKFEPDRNVKFPTYLANETRWRCLNIYNKQKKFQKEPLDDNFDQRPDTSFFLDEIQTEELINLIIKMAKEQKDERIKKIIDMRYGLNYNKLHRWREIAESLNMSIQGCIDIHDKFIKKIKRIIQNA
jgi:DNA-directed RNA polymerase sigma subunit (sigma70/sigma32)